MKNLQISIFVLIACAFFTSCTEEILDSEFQIESNNQDQLDRIVAPTLSLTSNVQECTTYGPISIMTFSWNAGSNLFGTIYVDIRDLNNQLIVTWSKDYTNTFNDLIFNIGYPPSGLKDCSFLMGNKKYHAHVYKYNSSGQYQMMPDFNFKTLPCTCTE